MIRQPDGSMRAYDSVNGYDLSGNEYGGRVGWQGDAAYTGPDTSNAAARVPGQQPFVTANPGVSAPAPASATNAGSRTTSTGVFKDASVGAPSAASAPPPTTAPQQPFATSPTGGLPNTVTTPSTGASSHAVDNTYSPGVSQVGTAPNSPVDRVTQVLARRFRPRDWSY